MGATDGGRRGFDPKSPRPPAPEHPPEPAAEAWTVGRLLQWTAEFLKAHAAEAPRLDAEVLLAHALGCRRIELYTAFEETPGEDRRAAFRELVRRRADGTPVAYLVGRREFYSLSFRVGPEVLIPRPETELLVIALLDLAKQPRRGSGVADRRRGDRQRRDRDMRRQALARLPSDGAGCQSRGAVDRRRQRRRARRRRPDRAAGKRLVGRGAARAAIRLRGQQPTLRQRGGVRRGWPRR